MCLNSTSKHHDSTSGNFCSSANITSSLTIQSYWISSQFSNHNLLFGRLYFAYALPKMQKYLSAYFSLQTSLQLSKFCSIHSMMKSFPTPSLAPLTGLAQSSSTELITLLLSLTQTFIFVPRCGGPGGQELGVFHLCMTQFLKQNLDETAFEQMKEMAQLRSSSEKRFEFIRRSVLFFSVSYE